MCVTRREEQVQHADRGNTWAGGCYIVESWHNFILLSGLEDVYCVCYSAPGGLLVYHLAVMYICLTYLSNAYPYHDWLSPGFVHGQASHHSGVPTGYHCWVRSCLIHTWSILVLVRFVVYTDWKFRVGSYRKSQRFRSWSARCTALCLFFRAVVCSPVTPTCVSVTHDLNTIYSLVQWLHEAVVFLVIKQTHYVE